MWKTFESILLDSTPFSSVDAPESISCIVIAVVGKILFWIWIYLNKKRKSAKTEKETKKIDTAIKFVNEANKGYQFFLKFFKSTKAKKKDNKKE